MSVHRRADGGVRGSTQRRPRVSATSATGLGALVSREFQRPNHYCADPLRDNQ